MANDGNVLWHVKMWVAKKAAAKKMMMVLGEMRVKYSRLRWGWKGNKI